jgi:crotonobetainyl-CoA:carnitine CoA-transferase CaiB-like acyl-CoA transferase
MTDETEKTLLAGIRVLDFGRYIAGPYCAALLADLGADVIRIEKLKGGEDRYVSPIAENGEGALFVQLNRNKRSLTLNPLKPDGSQIVTRLVETADIVIANMPAHALRGIGIDYQSLSSIKQEIILCSQTAFGDRGPYAKRLGFDGIGQAMSGATFMSGHGDQPVKSYASWVDFGTAMFAAFGAMAALMHRQQTGRGQEVKANLLRTGLNIFHFNNIEALFSGKNRPRTGNRSQFGGPADMFHTKDGWIQVQVVGQGLFERWCDMIGERHWIDDPRFRTDDDRGANGEALSKRTQEWCETMTTEAALKAFEKARIPAGPLLAPLEVFEDPQVKETGLLHDVDYPGLSRPAPVVGHPLEYSDTTLADYSRPPSLGEHTDEILKSIGYSYTEITSLRKNRVV